MLFRSLSPFASGTHSRMIRRTMNPEALNALANHPDIRPFIGGDGESVLDLSAQVRDPKNVALLADCGAWMLFHLAPGEFELHTMFLPAGRGKTYFSQAKEALRWMFTRTDATEIMTKCPDANPATRMAALLMGFRERFHLDDAWPDGSGVGHYAFTIDDWIARDTEALKVGTKFLADVDLPHKPDMARIIGASALVMMSGQVLKGLQLWNRWARFAGYPEGIQLGPFALGVLGALVSVERDGLEVMSRGT